MSGPYETPAQAREAARQACRDHPFLPLRRSVRCIMMAAISEAAVTLGSYDHAILSWLAGAEPEVAVVIAGLITRAHQAGRQAAP